MKRTSLLFLAITFADHAARKSASSRLRAILMTASAMISGMVPMALARAVIGGLIVSTFTTLTVLPSIYAILQSRVGIASSSLNPMDPESRYYDAH